MLPLEPDEVLDELGELLELELLEDEELDELELEDELLLLELLEDDELDDELLLELLEEDELLLLAACDCAMVVDNDTDRGLNCMAEARLIFSSSDLVLPCPFPSEISVTFRIKPPDFDSPGGFLFPAFLATEDLPFFAIALPGFRDSSTYCAMLASCLQ